MMAIIIKNVKFTEFFKKLNLLLILFNKQNYLTVNPIILSFLCIYMHLLHQKYQ